jgi:hypothetical protein
VFDPGRRVLFSETASPDAMEALVKHLLEFAMWSFFVIFAFAAIGVYATIKWIHGLITRGESAVEGARDALTRR